MDANTTVSARQAPEGVTIGALPEDQEAWSQLMTAQQALWAAGEHDWLAPKLARPILEGGTFDDLWLTLAQTRHGPYLTAIQDGQLAGFALLDGPRIMALWVRPELRRRGIGRGPVRCAEALGFPFVEIEYRAGNKTAAAFASALGYRRAKRRAVTIGDRRVGSVIAAAINGSGWLWLLLAALVVYPIATFLRRPWRL
jgi:hypothetical protein